MNRPRPPQPSPPPRAARGPSPLARWSHRAAFGLLLLLVGACNESSSAPDAVDATDAGLPGDVGTDAGDAGTLDAEPPPPPCVASPPLELDDDQRGLAGRTCAGTTDRITIAFTDHRHVELVFVDPTDALKVDIAPAPGLTSRVVREGSETTVELDRGDAGIEQVEVRVTATDVDVAWRLDATFLDPEPCDVFNGPLDLALNAPTTFRLCPDAEAVFRVADDTSASRSHAFQVIRTTRVAGPLVVEGAATDASAETFPPEPDARVESLAERVNLQLTDTGEGEVAWFRVANAGSMPLDLSANARAFDLLTTVPILARGEARFVDRPFDASGFLPDVESPVRYAAVEGIRDSDDATVFLAATDAEGRWSAAFPAVEGQSYRVRIHALADVRGHEVRVVDRSRARAVYAMESDAVRVDETSTEIQLDVLATRADELGGAFNILDAIVESIEFVEPWVEPGAPALSVEWEQGMPFACGSCYQRNRISLGGGVEDTDEYDDDIIFHEYGHYFVQWYSHDASPGGPHRDRVVAPRLAFGEGLAYWFAAAVRNTGGYVDTFEDGLRWVDIEAVTVEGGSDANLLGTSDGTLSGDLREEIVSGILWDLMDDDDAEPHDTIAWGLDRMMRVLTGPWRAREFVDVGARGTDLADFLQLAACDAPDEIDGILRIAEERAFPWTSRLAVDGPEDPDAEEGPTPCFKGHAAPASVPLHPPRARERAARVQSASGYALRLRPGVSARRAAAPAPPDRPR